ncbi:glycosyl transferase family A [Agrobacterium salinitolerans]|uniref:polysaccharide biosynthesis UDP-hexose transferase UppJ n=1 Tax=Agrobacterium salinitolerans TaxID=1183413 RepID=UPI00098F1D77|nr:polysaccharide biosynthesis UDP-hexose transferase UppJ [Agrobacterium salinitolerans]OOO28779.1 glycosyl transferase family A [Agrobacterium salinitolerans]PNQ26336.1 glycosyltransferase family 2 protein [Rhizobium sp. YIC5082]
MSEIMPEAVVCIPSFRRPEGLKKTLRSLAAQKVDFPFAIVVVDNDGAGQQGLAVARTFFSENGVNGQALAEPTQGNCYAINTAFRTARQSYPSAQWFLMIDDDEAASPQWLAEMVSAAKSFGVDIVGGPVNREFDAPASKAVLSHPLFGSIEAPTGLVEQIHGSGNCLISRRVFESLPKPEFDVQFNFLGGGDMDFFTRCRKAGFKFAWNARAVIIEYVPESRMAPRWIMERSLRTGIINYSIDRARHPGLRGGLLLTAKNAVSLCLSLLRAVFAGLKTGAWLPATHPPLMSIGRMMASLGITLTPYKAPAKKS